MAKSSSVSNFSIERILSLPSRQKKDSGFVQNPSAVPQSSSSQSLQPSYFASKPLKLPPLALTAPLPPSLAAFNSRMNRSVNCRSRAIPRSSAHEQLTVHSQTSSSSNQATTTTTKSKNAKKYKCDLCGRGFSRSNTLITHRVFIYLSSYIFFFSLI